MFKNLIKKILPPAAPDGLSNQIIADTIFDCFQDSLKQKSFDDFLLFNAHFIITLNPKKYSEFSSDFSTIAKSSVRRFYAALKNWNKKYPHLGDISNSWEFKFASATGRKDQKVSYQLTDEDVFVMGVHTGQKIGISNSGILKEGGSVRVTVKSRVTGEMETMDMDIYNSYPGFEIIDNGTFRFPINRNWELTTQDAEKIVSKSGKVYAIIEQSLPGGRTQEFSMIDREITISRGTPTTSTNNVFYIDQDSVAKPHLRIRYDPLKKLFEIAVFAQTRLNEVIVPVSEQYTPQWQPLPDNSNILLGGYTGLKFKIQ